MCCWPRILLLLVVALLGAGNLITACGLKGDLYLPEKGQPEPKRF